MSSLGNYEINEYLSQFHPSMSQTNIKLMVWSMFGERWWFADTAESWTLILYRSVFVPESSFCRCVFDCQRGESTVDPHKRLELSVFLEMLVPAQFCAVSKFFRDRWRWSGVWGLPYFPNPVIFDRSVANRCRSLDFGCVQVLLVDSLVCASRLNSKFEYVDRDRWKRTNKENKVRFF